MYECIHVWIRSAFLSIFIIEIYHFYEENDKREGHPDDQNRMDLYYFFKGDFSVRATRGFPF